MSPNHCVVNNTGHSCFVKDVETWFLLEAFIPDKAKCVAPLLPYYRVIYGAEN
jgi:hypothetical protein